MTDEKNGKKEIAAMPPEGTPLFSGPAFMAREERSEKEGPLMYVGPTVPGIGIQNRVYTEMPKEAKERAERTPEIRLLFIPVKDYPRANQMLREGRGYLYDAYCTAEKGGIGA